MAARSAIVAGATGLVGGALVDALLADDAWDEVTLVGRRRAPREHTRLRHVTADLAALPPDALPPDAAAAFCCLGTTIRKAGTQEAFRAVDHGLALAFARACAARGARSLHVVSALGANPSSRVFYNRVKGEMERELREIGAPSVYAYRPSLLLGKRDEPRPAERAGILAATALAPLIPRKWRGVTPERVARAMIERARHPTPGFHVVENAEIS